ncbi:cathelicidin antimicrobial peptide [Dipodomys spectabilis]|uniref:cathelicidin antimicrobial peptide n=1 Tax=Dipodomys spectabilis TaxID=105255 RepID=UPI001C5419C2|nr:cathelicidin antimicrobial peptide [Dipodomys spectabilis]
MHAQREGLFLGQWALVLILLMPPAFAQSLSYQEAVLRAVDSFNQRSLDTNAYRLLALDSQPQGEEDPDSPKPVSFTMKETVCPKGSRQALEQCDFKENGLVRRCVGTVTMDQGSDSDLDCNLMPQPVHKISQLGKFLREGGKKIGKKLEKLGQKIKDFFHKFAPKGEPPEP